MTIKKIILSVFLFFSLGSTMLNAQRVEPNWESINKRGYPQWFADAKLGIFVHWGLYSVPAQSSPDGYAEWFYRGLMTEDTMRCRVMNDYVRQWGSLLGDQWGGRMGNGDDIEQEPKMTDQYGLFVPLWKAEKWNPDQWAELFKKAGAKYVLLVTKHHDGYCLWDSPQQPAWNSVATGPRRDIVGELTSAVRRADMKMGFYYSLTEWTNPLHIWMQDPDDSIGSYVKNYMIPQFKQLVSKYHPSVIFTDGEWQNSADQFHATDLISWYYNTVGAEAIVNDRWGHGTQHGFRTPEYKGAINDTVRPWAECRGMGRSFGLNLNEPLSNYLTSDSLIRHFVKLVAAGGGMTLNVGPAADGTIPMIQQERLLDLGHWLSINGEAIYESRPYTRMCENDSCVFYTRRGTNVYAIATHLNSRYLILNDMPKPHKEMKVVLLGTGKEIKWRYVLGKLMLDTSKLTPADLEKLHSAYVFKLSNILITM